METSGQGSKNFWSKPITRVLFVVGVLLVIIVFIYLQYFSHPNLPPEFLSLYHDQDQRAKQVLQSSPFSFGQIGQHIQSNEFKEMNDLATKGLNQALTNTNRVDNLDKQLIVLRATGASITEPRISSKLMRLFSLIDSRNKQFREVVLLQQQVFTTMREFYVAQEAGQKVTLPDSINQSINDINRDIQSASDLQLQIDTTYSGILDTAGLMFDAVDIQEGIRTSLTQTPNEEITVTDIPFPTPTEGPVQGPQASPSATIQPIASSSAVTP